jgi:hypothetical protein
MKLSEALQKAIDTEMYSWEQHVYMCHALKALGLREHVAAVMEKVHSMDPCCSALLSALMCTGQMPDEASDLEGFEACKDFYLQWIEELKSQNL